jgi:SAM-dependent methyltransferase
MLTCRHCRTALDTAIVDLGHQPASNAYLAPEQLLAPEITYPLKVYLCEHCWLVQLPEHAAPEALFTPDYAYFSSVSRSWVAHAEAYVTAMVERFDLSEDSFVTEVASNDGYLLQFVKARGIPCLGIEPTAMVAAAARRHGIDTEELFLGEASGLDVARRHRKANLVVANNVLAHVPDIGDFVRGIAAILASEGVVTFEFPHVQRLVEGLQFDTIYHEHYSYLSLAVAKRILSDAADLRVFDVEDLPTHGGSLRVFACHAKARHPTTEAVWRFLHAEEMAGVATRGYYDHLQKEAERVKDELLSFLISEKRAGRTVVGYGAAAKGNTLLNFAGIRPDLLPFVCDASPSKQGKYLPGSHVPIVSPDYLEESAPDVVLVLPWNIAREIHDQLQHHAPSGIRYATAVPRLVFI